MYIHTYIQNILPFINLGADTNLSFEDNHLKIHLRRQFSAVLLNHSTNCSVQKRNIPGCRGRVVNKTSDTNPGGLVLGFGVIKVS